MYKCYKLATGTHLFYYNLLKHSYISIKKSHVNLNATWPKILQV